MERIRVTFEVERAGKIHHKSTVVADAHCFVYDDDCSDFGAGGWRKSDPCANNLFAQALAGIMQCFVEAAHNPSDAPEIRLALKRATMHNSVVHQALAYVSECEEGEDDTMTLEDAMRAILFHPAVPVLIEHMPVECATFAGGIGDAACSYSILAHDLAEQMLALRNLTDYHTIGEHEYEGMAQLDDLYDHAARILTRR